MNLLETLKQFKNITPDPAYKENSKRVILATLPSERWNVWRSVTAIFETGIAVALAVFFILVITGQFSGSSLVSPVQFSAIDPKTLNAEAQAVDIQIQLANVAYQEASTTVAISASTPQAPAAAASAMRPAFTAMSVNIAETSTTEAPTSSTPASTTVSVDEALKALSE